MSACRLWPRAVSAAASNLQWCWTTPGRCPKKTPPASPRSTTLKSAAASLVNQLFANSDANVRVALVPYADYVNVGVKNRSASWLNVPTDYSTTPAPKTCTTLTTKTVCLAYAPTYACTKTTDGVVEPATCGGGCTKSEVQTVAPYQSCTGGGSPVNYKWFGCVGSRMLSPAGQSPDRITDNNPSDRYPGYLDTSAEMPEPIASAVEGQARQSSRPSTA
jgi:hypothetical protein